MVVEIKKEIIMSNATIANDLIKDGSVLESIDEIIGDILYNKYGVDYDSRCDATASLNTEDYIEIFRNMATKMEKELNKFDD